MLTKSALKIKLHRYLSTNTNIWKGLISDS